MESSSSSSSSQHLIDSLTSHIALYHSRSPIPNPNPSPRSAVLRWLASLPTPTRQSILTFTNPSFTQLLLKMSSHLAAHGPTLFFLLPDLPSASSASLPSLCHRKSRGLLVRAMPGSSVSSGLLLFGSKDENLLDSVTVSEDLVGDVNGFVKLMDEVSNGRFLRGEEVGLGEEWKEMGWLKDKGYFSLDEFVANRLELVLRRSWGRGKGKGCGVMGESAFWRKKGCVDWWAAIDARQRRVFCLELLGKMVKSLANEIIEGKNIVLKNKFGFLKVEAEWPQKFGPTSCWQRPKMPCLRSNSDVCWDTNLGSGMPHHLVKLLNRLLVIQEISAIILACRLNKVEKETLFFSRVESVRTVSDYIMRKFRGLIMAVSIDYISRELLGDEKLETLPDKPEVKKLNSRKGKKKPRNSKRINSITNSSKVDSASLESTMHNECRFDCQTDSSSKLCHQEKNFPTATNWKTDADNTCILPKDPGKEHAIGLLDCKGPGDRKRNRGKGTKRKNTSLKKVVESDTENQKTYIPVISVEDKVEESVELADASTLLPILSDLTPDGTHELCLENGKNENSQSDCSLPFADNCCCSRPDKVEAGIRDWALPSHARDGQNPQMSPCPIFNGDHVSNKQINSFVNYSTVTSVCDNTRLAFPTLETGSTVMENEHMLHYGLINGNTLQSIPPKVVHTAMNEKNEKSTVIQSGGTGPNIHNHANFMGGTSYEWPSTTLHLTSSSSPHFPAATDRLHLDVGHRQPNHFRQSFVTSRHQSRNPPVEAAHGRTVPSLTLPMSYDWPPVVKNCGRLNQTVTISYDTAFNPPLPPSFCSGFAAREMQISGACSENEEFPDDTESYWLSEEESGPQAFTGRDYNQFFGGGVMYWNSAEHVGTGFSRPPSHSSEDSSWAWYEADLNRAIDDMIGLASPSAVPYCSPFDPLGPGHQPSASDVPEERPLSLSKLPGCFEGVKADTLPYTMLRPIIVPRISREGSRSEFNVSRDHNSPCFPSRRHNHPHSKRPPSPVVLCIPRVPRPPPPSPVSESRKRGFPIVRSGSSSPRHWGLRNGFHEDGNTEDPRLCMDGAEVVWPSWGTKGLSGTPVAQSIQGSLLQNHLLTISQEHPDVALPLQPPEVLNCPHKASLTMLHNLLHEEIEFFCRQVAAENLIKKPYINWAVKRVTRSLQDLWPRSRTNVFGSNATGLALPTSDVDLVVSLPPVRNLEPIKEAGILEGRNGIKETCLQHAARYLANQEWVRNDSLKTIENTAIPIIMLVAEVSQDINYSDGNSSILEVQNAQPTNMPAEGASNSDQSSSEDTSLITCSKTRKDGGIDVKLVRLDISFKSPSHTGLQTSKLVRELTQQFPASVPLALVLKKFLADRSLDHSYSGGLSSYCLVLLITRFLQHEHHICRSINQNLGSLLMDFLYFFGNVFDPRQMRISIQGSGVYMKRERGLSIDPIHIDDPLFPSNNVGRNCFRIHQCIKAFADAFSVLENELSQFSDDSGPSSTAPFELLRKIIPSIDREE